MEQKKELQTQVSMYSTKITERIMSDYSSYGLVMDDYSKGCIVAAVGAIHNLVVSSKEDMSKMNFSNIQQVVSQVSSLKLNANAVPRECYFTLRGRQKADKSWEKVVELGIEGDGNDSILRNFGVDVKKVHPCWLVKEGDDFTYPRHVGIKVEPPSWFEKGKSIKVVRVVYPIELNDGTVQYNISEREQVKSNLVAHIRNNMMKETFGLTKADDLFKATPKEKEEIKQKKREMLELASSFETVDEIISCEELRPFMSPAWLDSPEAMIIRKMRNNCIKKFPKDMNAVASQSITQLDETYVESKEIIEQNANQGEVVDIEIAEDIPVCEDAEFIEVVE